MSSNDSRFCRCRIVAIGFLAAAFFASHVNATKAAAIDLPLVHIAADLFPDLKSKSLNSNFALDGAAGNAVMRSRYASDISSDGKQVIIFGYQVDLTATYVIAGHPGVSAVTLDLPQPPMLMASANLSNAKLYIVDEDGAHPGIGIQSVDIDGGKMTFTFTTPLRAGTGPGNGDHSLWFGLVTNIRGKRGQISLSTLPVSQAAQQPPVKTATAKISTAQAATPPDKQKPAAAPVDLANPKLEAYLPLADTTTP